MKVKVYLQPKGDVFFSEQEKNNNFLTTYFKKIELARVEPDCPFCGMKLKNACCQCLEFANACSGLLAKYKAEAVDFFGKEYEWELSGFLLKAENMTLSSVVSEDNLLQLFYLGTQAKVGDEMFWVSEGTFDRKILKFYIYHMMKVYECRIKELSYQPEEGKVSLCKYEKHFVFPKDAYEEYVGGNGIHLEEETITLAQLGYTKYLQKIKKMVKKK